MNKIILLVPFLICASPTIFAQNDDLLSKRTVKLSPQVRIIERKESIPTIKIEEVQQFLNRPYLISPETEYAAYIVSTADQSILTTVGRKIYANNLYDQEEQKYVIVRPGQILPNPLEKGEVLAYEAVYLGEAELQVPGDPATLVITKANREIKVGDRLLQKEDESVLREDFYPHSPKSLEEAYVIAVIDETLIIGQNQIVILNKGLHEGLERGHILAVNKAGKRVFDVANQGEEIILPKQQAGILLVFHVFDQVSYALVISASLSINIFDEVSVLGSKLR